MEQQQQNEPPTIHDGWIKHQRNSAKTTQSFSCLFCLDRKIFSAADDWWRHTTDLHRDKLPPDDKDWEAFRPNFEAEARLKRSALPRGSSLPRLSAA
jgi:hypothetical protein